MSYSEIAVKPGKSKIGRLFSNLFQIIYDQDSPLSLQSLTIHLVCKECKTFWMLIMFKPPERTDKYIIACCTFWHPFQTKLLRIFCINFTWSDVIQAQLQTWTNVEKTNVLETKTLAGNDNFLLLQLFMILLTFWIMVSKFSLIGLQDQHIFQDISQVYSGSKPLLHGQEPIAYGQMQQFCSSSEPSLYILQLFVCA